MGPDYNVSIHADLRVPHEPDLSTPLMIAAYVRNRGLVKLLIQSGASVPYALDGTVAVEEDMAEFMVR